MKPSSMSKRFYMLLAIGVAFLCGFLYYQFSFEIDFLRMLGKEGDSSPSVLAKRSRRVRNETDFDVEEMFQYFHWKNEDHCPINQHFGGKLHGSGTRRGFDGQKCMCMIPGIAPDASDCLIYSFGINFDWSFDKAMEEYGCQVYSFDPSMGLANHSYSSRIHFYNLGLSSENTEPVDKGWRMATLQRIRQDLGHSNRTIDYLKMDIEGWEWPILRQLLNTSGLSDVKQIAMEIHLADGPKLLEFRTILEQLESSGFVRFSSLANYFVPMVYGPDKYQDYCCYEVAWFNSNFSIKPNKK